MGWYGKLIGLVLGAIIGRGLFGAIVGFLIGHLFDRRAADERRTGAVPSRDLQVLFFRTTFQVMGHVAKADGRVTEQEIDAARHTMRRFSLSDADVRRAIDLFNQGKSADFPLEDALGEFRAASAGREDLRRLFVQIQLEAALQAGYASTDDMNGYRQEGFGPMDMTTWRGRRWSAGTRRIHARASGVMS